MRTERVAVTPVIAVLAVLLAACGSVSSGTPDSGSTRADLEGSWHLVSGHDAEGRLPRVAGREVTLVVDSEGAGGSSACNHYGVTLSVDGDKVGFADAYGTEMACEPEVMVLEQRYLAALGAVVRAERDGRELTLSGPRVTLRFELDEPARDSALVGTTSPRVTGSGSHRRRAWDSRSAQGEPLAENILAG